MSLVLTPQFHEPQEAAPTKAAPLVDARHLAVHLRNGIGPVLVDGEDISNEVMAFTLTAAPGQVARLAITPLVVEATPARRVQSGELEVEGGPVRLYISDATRELLIKYGWTPPPADVVDAELVDEQPAAIEGGGG